MRCDVGILLSEEQYRDWIRALNPAQVLPDYDEGNITRNECIGILAGMVREGIDVRIPEEFAEEVRERVESYKAGTVFVCGGC